ncbi:MAG TPA: beta-propeller fold lactonase family protein, partial [Acidimicrobiales bacterium]
MGTNTGVAVVPTSAMVAEPACDTSGSTASLAKVCGAPVADIVVDPSGARAYATNRQRNQVEVFSLATRRLETPIPVGSRPQGLDLSADGRLLYVANSGANDVSVVDLALGREVRRITVPTTWLNERPHSIAVAANGTALMTTTFEGSGNSAMWLIDLGDETLRPPPPIRTYDTEVGARSRVEPSADRSHILLVETDSSAGEVFLLDTSAGTWDQKTLARFVTFGALDATGSTVLVGPGTFVLDGDLVLRSTVPGGGAGVASNRAGTVGYRVQDGYVEVLDLGRGTVTATLELPEDLGTSRGVVALTPDDATLLVATATGVSAVPVSAADPLPVCTSTLADICGAGLDEVVVDPAGRRAYVSNPLLNQVEVISLTTRQLEAPIPVGSLPLGMDFSADGRLLYVANSGATDVSVVDLALRREVRRIPVPSGWLNERPRSIAVAANGRAFLTTDYGGSGWTDLLEIDLDDETVSVRPIDRGDPFGGNATVTSETDLYASGDRSRVALVQNDNSSGPVTVYDAASDSFAPLRRLANFTGPSALDRTGSTLLVDGWVLDRDLVQRATIGPFRGTGVALSPDGAHGYRAAEEAVEVLDIRRGLVVGSIPVPERPAAGHRGLTVTPDGATLLVLTERGVAIAPVSSAVALPACTPETVAGAVVRVCGDLFWAAGSRVGEIVVDAAGARAYATNPSRNQVEVVSLATRTLEAPIAVGSQPMGLDFSADGRTLYVANSGGNDLSVVDLASRREVRRIVVPPGEFNHRPQSIVVAGNGTALVLTTFDGSGWSHLRQVDLAAGTVRVRTDLREFGVAAGDVADFAATADRSRIVMVSRDGTYLYDVARDSLVGATSPESCRRFVDVDASGATVLASRCILEGDGRHRATIEGFGRGVAITSSGDRGYRVLGNSVQSVDLATGATSSGEALP